MRDGATAKSTGLQFRSDLLLVENINADLTPVTTERSPDHAFGQCQKGEYESLSRRTTAPHFVITMKIAFCNALKIQLAVPTVVEVCSLWFCPPLSAHSKSTTVRDKLILVCLCEVLFHIVYRLSCQGPRLVRPEEVGTSVEMGHFAGPLFLTSTSMSFSYDICVMNGWWMTKRSSRQPFQLENNLERWFQSPRKKAFRTEELIYLYI